MKESWPNCSPDQAILLSLQLILCRWVGISTAGEVKVCAHDNSTDIQICFQVCVSRAIVCIKKGWSQTVFTLALSQTHNVL